MYNIVYTCMEFLAQSYCLHAIVQKGEGILYELIRLDLFMYQMAVSQYSYSRVMRLIMSIKMHDKLDGGLDHYNCIHVSFGKQTSLARKN